MPRGLREASERGAARRNHPVERYPAADLFRCTANVEKYRLSPLPQASRRSGDYVRFHSCACAYMQKLQMHGKIYPRRGGTPLRAGHSELSYVPGNAVERRRCQASARRLRRFTTGRCRSRAGQPSVALSRAELLRASGSPTPTGQYRDDAPNGGGHRCRCASPHPRSVFLDVVGSRTRPPGSCTPGSHIALRTRTRIDLARHTHPQGVDVTPDPLHKSRQRDQIHVRESQNFIRNFLKKDRRSRDSITHRKCGDLEIRVVATAPY